MSSQKKQKDKKDQKAVSTYASVNTQSTVNSLKEILIPQIKETQAKIMVDIYEKKYGKKKKNSESNKNNQNDSKSILEYSFVTGKNKYKKNDEKKEDFKKNYNEINQEDFYERQLEKQMLKEKYLNERKEQLLKQELKEVKSKPTISKNSILLMKNKNIIPIYKRLDQIEGTLREKTRQTQIEVLRDNNKYQRRNKSQSNYITDEEFNRWLEMNKTWDKIRKAKLNYKKNELDEIKRQEELLNKEDETFNPKINKNTSSLLARDKTRNIEVSERLYKTHFKYKNKIERKRQNSLPSFKPLINKKYKIKDEYYEYMDIEQKEIFDILNVF